MAKKLAFDKLLFTVVIVLLGVGLTMVFSASSALARDRHDGPNPYLFKQAGAAAVGLVGMWLVMHLDYRRLRQMPAAYFSLFAVLALLVLALFQPALNGTRRWVFVGGMSLQPSELAKIAVVLYVAYQVARHEERAHVYELLVPCTVAVGALAGLIVMQPDLGTAGVVALVGATMLFLAGIPWRFFAGGLAALAPLVYLAVRLEPYRWQRVTAFLDPERHLLGAGFQADQSLVAVGSGGILGLGLGDSVQKLYYLPHPESDFIYSIVAEELGLVGAAILLALFAVLLWRGVRAGLKAPDLFGRHLAWGLTTVLVAQALIHVSVALSLVPTTGIPLPFISAGGSSLVSTLVACGLLLNVSQHA
ncbi:MAG: putative lipid II flippase FtsW [Acidobacteriota bacterium]|nr:putative lipid II flippase FtsW [Acidobacteriota bacterium]MDH3522006.1 putative lipid II flippase FtsW [Acidobacteriota bacterium]